MIGDLRRNIVSVYKADTSGMERGLDKIRDGTKKLGDETAKTASGIDGLVGKQKTMTDQLKSWNEEVKRVEQVNADAWRKVGLALAGVTAAVVAGKEAFSHYAREQKLMAEAGAVNIDRLSAAAGGLLTRMELLDFAAKAQAGAHKLNAEQMETALKAIDKMSGGMAEMKDVTDKVTEAILTLDTEELKKFGIYVKETSNDTEKFASIMEALGGKAKMASGATDDGTRSIKQMGVEFQNTFDKIKSAIGEMVIAMGPLIRAAGMLASKAADLISYTSGGLRDLSDLLGASFGSSSAEAALLGRYQMRRDKDGNLRSVDAFGEHETTGGTIESYQDGTIAGQMMRGEAASEASRYYGARAGARDRGITPEQIAQREREDAAEAALKRARRGTGAAALLDGGGYEDMRALMGEAFEMIRDAVVEGAANAADGIANARTDATSSSLASASSALSMSSAESAAIQGFDLEAAMGDRNAEAYEAFRANKQQTFLESTFGTLEEFHGYQMAFQALTGSVSVAMSAWIDGSMSAGEAVKKFLGEALKGLASSMAVEALKHGAYALGSLAFGDVRGAGQHAAAAGAFALGAGMAASAAKALGGGAGPATATAGAGAGGGRGMGAAPMASSSDPHSGRAAIVVIGNDFTRGGPRQRRRHAEELVNLALGSNAVVYG